ncbi:MAG: transporter substrate-binding domain-containing protein [Caldisericia bacterium]|jgi:polar amino acid transport system substrate-binding protein|nr:transporter substrate-binding domain-containing protein [Caldisericia bacterium]
MKKLVILLILFLLFISCEKKPKDSVLKGRVLDENGSPISDVEILILENGLSFKTHEDGTFYISYPFEKRTYTLLFHKEGFVDEEKKVDLIDSEEEIEVVLTYNTFEKITKKGTILIGTSLNDKPLSYSEGGKKLGFEVDLIRKISEMLALSPTILRIDKDKLLESLINRDIDLVISGISEKDINFELKEKLIFSRPYFIDGYVIIVRDNEEKIKDLSTLNGKRVYLTEKNLIDVVKNFSPNIKKIEVETCLEYCLEDLERVVADAIITKFSTASYYAKRYKKIKIVDFVYDMKGYSIILRKEDEEILKKIDEIISNLIETQEFYKIYNRWFYPLDKFKVS